MIMPPWKWYTPLKTYIQIYLSFFINSHICEYSRVVYHFQGDMIIFLCTPMGIWKYDHATLEMIHPPIKNTSIHTSIFFFSRIVIFLSILGCSYISTMALRLFSQHGSTSYSVCLDMGTRYPYHPIQSMVYYHDVPLYISWRYDFCTVWKYIIHARHGTVWATDTISYRVWCTTMVFLHIYHGVTIIFAAW